MSRHRNVKNLIDEDYYDDYDDDYYDDYDDYDTYTGGSSAGAAAAKKKQPAVAKPKNTPTPKKPAAATAKKQAAAGTTSNKQPQPQQQAKLKSPSRAKTPPPPPGVSVAAASSAKAAAPTTSVKSSPQAPSSSSSNTPVTPLPIPAILLEQQQQQQTTKPEGSKTNLTVVVIGHVDAGKSTVTGHLLYGSGNAGGSSSSNRRNRNQPINYAWLLDEDEQERAHGVTMDIATKQLETARFQIVLQDAPGHSDYVPAMITGTSAADAALLTVDATDLHTALHSGGQLREHAFLAKGLGVNQILVVFNKMDLIGWDNRAQYDALRAEMLHFLTRQVHYQEKKVRFVPVSGLTGTNIFPSSGDDDGGDEETRKLRSWYEGPTLQEALDAFDPPVQQQSKLLEKPLRIVVSDVLDSSGAGVGLRAKVVTGWAKQGEAMVVLPVGDETVLTKLSSLHSNLAGAPVVASSDERRHYCVAGELIDCTVTGIDAQRISTGSILARPHFRPPLADRCRAKIFVLDGIAIPLIRGAQTIFHMHHLDVPCHLAVLVRTLKPDGTSVLKERPRALTKSCTAIVELQLAVPVCMEAFSDCRALARFVLRRSGDSIAVGRIEEVLNKK